MNCDLDQRCRYCSKSPPRQTQTCIDQLAQHCKVLKKESACPSLLAVTRVFFQNCKADTESSSERHDSVLWNCDSVMCWAVPSACALQGYGFVLMFLQLSKLNPLGEVKETDLCEDKRCQAFGCHRPSPSEHEAALSVAPEASLPSWHSVHKRCLGRHGAILEGSVSWPPRTPNTLSYYSSKTFAIPAAAATSFSLLTSLSRFKGVQSLLGRSLATGPGCSVLS